jgi:hypothetical protein
MVQSEDTPTTVDQIARIVDADAFARYDPFSKSMFNGEYLHRIEEARKKAVEILTLLGLSGE